MLDSLQKNLPAILLLLTALFGVALGSLAAAVAGSRLRPPLAPPGKTASRPSPTATRPTLNDYAIILQRNVFDSTAANPGLFFTDNTAGAPSRAAASHSSFTLLGTVAAGTNSIAVLRNERETSAFRPGDDLPGGGRLEEVGRKVVLIKHADGSLETLQLYEGEAGGGAPPSDSGESAGIKELGANRWVIPRTVAEQARGNLNELLKQARMEPKIVDGKTEGFVVKMIRPKSLLDTLGIRQGDLLLQVNSMALDTPEKALQIFQQLREAKHLSINLQRSGTPMTFEYEVN